MCVGSVVTDHCRSIQFKCTHIGISWTTEHSPLPQWSKIKKKNWINLSIVVLKNKVAGDFHSEMLKLCLTMNIQKWFWPEGQCRSQKKCRIRNISTLVLFLSSLVVKLNIFFDTVESLVSPSWLKLWLLRDLCWTREDGLKSLCWCQSYPSLAPRRSRAPPAG